MPKYIVEGAVDFFSELYKSLDDEEDTNENVCLITNMPLTDNFIELQCGHKFNYVPLYKDIYSHKKNFNYLESSSGKLGKNEIRCPYCRKKQNEVLPYYENMGVNKVPGVNQVYVEEAKTSKTAYPNHRCSFMMKIGTDTEEVQCSGFGTPICIYTHGTNYGDTKLYCWSHKKAVLRKYKNDILVKAKADALKVKTELKKAKEEAILKEKEEKKIAKELTKKDKKTKTQKKVVLNVSQTDENVVISSLEEPVCCIAVLKTGANKGAICGKKACNVQDKLCSRHCLKPPTSGLQENKE